MWQVETIHSARLACGDLSPRSRALLHRAMPKNRKDLQQVAQYKRSIQETMNKWSPYFATLVTKVSILSTTCDSSLIVSSCIASKCLTPFRPGRSRSPNSCRKPRPCVAALLTCNAYVTQRLTRVHEWHSSKRLHGSLSAVVQFLRRCCTKTCSDTMS